MDKDTLRRRIRARKSLLDAVEAAKAAEQVFSRLESLVAFTMADRILIYNSLPDELSTRDFISRWKSVKHFFLPRVNGIDLDILPYDSTRMSLGAFRIEEPQGDDITDPALMELIIVPAMAYDRKGNRLGRGKGYYDRLLPRSKALRIGVAYDFQLVDELETDPFDQPVDIVITESGIYRRR
ncbi:MAG: 5-formyltetrahydrofolate cyclo-ligase [Paramuribaculum sp.]